MGSSGRTMRRDGTTSRTSDDGVHRAGGTDAGAAAAAAVERGAALADGTAATGCSAASPRLAVSPARSTRAPVSARTAATATAMRRRGRVRRGTSSLGGWAAPRRDGDDGDQAGVDEHRDAGDRLRRAGGRLADVVDPSGVGV